jgi:glycosyltransferase involved in cell wall biosynthesis
VPFFRELVAKGIDVDVAFYYPGTAGGWMGFDKDFGIEICWDIDLLSGYHYQIFLDDQATYSRREQLRLAPQLLRWSLKDRKTPLLLIGWFVELVWLIWLLRIISQAPVLLLGETNQMSYAAAAKPRWRAALLGWLIQHTTAICFIGSRNKEFVRQMGAREERLFRTPYSIDNDRFSTERDRLGPSRSELCHEFGIRDDLPTFLFCGKLIEKKRPIQLLEAYVAAGLADKAQLLYVGEGEQRSLLEGRIRTLGLRHVNLLGFFNQTQMPKAYVLGEVLCLISGPTETWGLVVNEALACGRPAIVTDTVGCTPDLVTTRTGWVTPLDDHERLVATLQEAYKSHNQWGEMAPGALDQVAGNTFSAMADGVREALQFIQSSQAQPKNQSQNIFVNEVGDD